MGNKKEQIPTEIKQILDLLFFQFGQQLRRLRIGAGVEEKMTQTELAVRLSESAKKTTTAEISGIENGKLMLRLSSMVKIAWYFGYTLELRWVKKPEQQQKKRESNIKHSDTEQVHIIQPQTGTPVNTEITG